jgi:hypothetical protein
MNCSGYIPSFIENIDLEFLYKVNKWKSLIQSLRSEGTLSLLRHWFCLRWRIRIKEVMGWVRMANEAKHGPPSIIFIIIFLILGSISI